MTMAGKDPQERELQVGWASALSDLTIRSAREQDLQPGPSMGGSS